MKIFLEIATLSIAPGASQIDNSMSVPFVSNIMESILDKDSFSDS